MLLPYLVKYGQTKHRTTPHRTVTVRVRVKIRVNRTGRPPVRSDAVFRLTREIWRSAAATDTIYDWGRILMRRKQKKHLAFTEFCAWPHTMPHSAVGPTVHVWRRYLFATSYVEKLMTNTGPTYRNTENTVSCMHKFKNTFLLDEYSSQINIQYQQKNSNWFDS